MAKANVGQMLGEAGVGPEDAKVLGDAAVRLVLGDLPGGLRPGDPASRILERISGEGKERNRCLATLSAAIVDACRDGATSVASFLETEHGLNPGAASAIAGTAEKHRKRISADLAELSTATSLPRLRSVEWRLDVRKDRAKRAAEPHFHVDLKPGASFACNLEEMQDLVATLKDACLSMKRNEKAYHL